MTLRIALWNVQWARPSSERGQAIGSILTSRPLDLICVTEGCREILPDGGHVLESEADYGYRQVEGRRKVLLWSGEPWEAPDRVGAPGLPPGRYAGGFTHTPVGRISVCGVCIPWAAAHVTTGRKDRKRWEDHLSYLSALPSAPNFRAPEAPTLVLGDFNQRIPRKYTPKHVFGVLEESFEGLEIPTAGAIEGAEGLSIDHVAHTEELQAVEMGVWPKETPDGLRLSDHFGIWVEMEGGR